MNKIQLKRIIQDAFIGYIAEGFRAVAFDFLDTTIKIIVYLNRKPNEKDYEIVDMAVTEILASAPQFLKQEIIIEENHLPIGKLEAFKGWIFVRYED
ncbi:hypothetical protein [Sphingobacterium bovistauri]|uniref:Uncharacterized protein n=1 Tax=Sphingobacterium bovistauri TaxID=2781959 RepID=A0ABS7Z4W5_9SPHI|nr:hypothetical protein [Sphingobacterium bovistauri]MCA5005236.1 hypothetical protein [Sphingobacterium bovistauri]